VYFGAQVTTLGLLFLLGSSRNDAFNFLFVMLCIHAAVVFPARAAAFWITLCYGVVAAITLLIHGAGGLYAVFFYAITFIISGFFGYALRQTEQARERNQRLLEELQSTQQRLKELAVVEERNRLARDLHDSVKQQVFAISMQLGAARTALSESDKAYSPVLEAERLAQQAGGELTTLIHQLRPPSLERKSLTEAIKEYANEWSRQNNIEIILNLEDALPLNVNEEQTFFRVIQEALSNIARHSQATYVELELLHEDSAILFRVADNGKGLEAGGVRKGVGLHSMQERLTQIGATFNITSEKGHGMQITSILERA
jgi:NarL family two-component system sensor histidine kinase LiaS